MDRSNRIAVPVFEYQSDGAIRPNRLFHRSWHKLHSRCIEYPFAASRLADAKVLLDVGVAQADPVWIAWLEGLPLEVHATDYDTPDKPFDSVVFHKADIRSLPFDDEVFDKVFAVSVVEHVGLVKCQVRRSCLPATGDDGDLAAVRELVRVLKAGGELVMTMPFGVVDGPILGDSARCYTMRTIRKFEAYCRPELLEYYEYQHRDIPKLYCEERSLWRSLASRALRLVGVGGGRSVGVKDALQPRHLGGVTWRRIPLSEARASHRKHVDGVICSVWAKA